MQIDKDIIDYIFDIKYKDTENRSDDTDDDWNNEDIVDQIVPKGGTQTFEDKLEHLHDILHSINVEPIYTKNKEFIMAAGDTKDEKIDENLFGEFDPDSEVSNVDEKTKKQETEQNQDEESTDSKTNIDEQSNDIDNDQEVLPKEVANHITKQIESHMNSTGTSPQTTNDNNFDNIKTIDGVKVENGKIQWILSTHNNKWHPIYEMKKEALNILFNYQEQLNYYELIKELRETSAQVDAVWDNESTYEQMRVIQNHRDRIKQIQIDCNDHLFFLDRFLDMLRGKVDGIEYNRPASKQEGLYHLHLRDLEIYLSWLKSLQKSSEMCVKTLDGAFETLSRQITIMMPQRDAANAMNRINNAVKNKSKSERRHDTNNNYDSLNASLSSGDAAENKKKKTGESISWDDI